MIARFTRKDFLEALFADYYKEHRGFILVKSFRQGEAKMSTRYFPNIDILAKEHYGEERDVYFGICPRERMKAEKEHIHYMVALWADLDIGAEGHENKSVYFEGPQQAAKAIRSFPRAPSIIVESGRGAHLYWLLKNVTQLDEPDKAEGLLKKISEILNCDTDVSIDTALRLPETVNTKIGGKPVNCDVKFINTNFRYSLSDFEGLSERIVVAGPPTQAEPPPSPETIMETPDLEAPIEAPPGVPEPPTSGVQDSLIVDETIIDELIDDISMTASVVTEAPADEGDFEPEPPSQGISLPGTAEPTTATRPVAVAPLVSHSQVLSRLSSSKTMVEISLIGSEDLINGVLVWNENGLIGVESGSDLYTIPLSSVSFIKSRVG